MNTSNITNYKPKDFAELLGVSVKTLQRWDREGTLKANRTPTDCTSHLLGVLPSQSSPLGTPLCKTLLV